MRIGGARWSARFWYDLHSSIGFFSLIPVLLLAGTGVVMGFENEFTLLIDRVSNSQPVRQSPFAVASTSQTVAAEITPDQALAIAMAQVPGALPYRVQMPRYGGFYVVALEYPENRVTGERNFISVDPANGRIVSLKLSSDLKFRERFFAFNGTIHTGSFWGMPSKIIAALASILLPVQGLSGLLIWLRRKGLLHRR
jgi:sulfite reductase (NADPH) flavoprotein alpha-component